MNELFSTLNESQKQAVLYNEGPLLVVAGPGSGKTRVITHKISYLISEKTIHPHQILAVTFTNKAAKEISSRVKSMNANIKFQNIKNKFGEPVGDIVVKSSNLKTINFPKKELTTFLYTSPTETKFPVKRSCSVSYLRL